MSRNSTEDAASIDLDLNAGFDVVLVPHGTTDPDIVVGKLGPGSRGVVVHTNGVRRAKRWFRLRAHGAEPVTSWYCGAKSGINREETMGVLYFPAMADPQSQEDAQQRQLLTKLGKSLEQVEERQRSFRRDLRAAVRKGEEMLKEAIG